MGTPPVHIVLLTTDFRPLTGGIPEYLHGLWNQLARCHPVTVMTPVSPGPLSWEHAYRLETLPPVPDCRLESGCGDRLPPVRKLTTGAYFSALRRYADDTVARMREVGGADGQPFIGIWDTVSHFWCRALREAGTPYHLHVYGVEMTVPLYGRLPEWRTEDFRRARQIVAVSRGTAELASHRFASGVPVNVATPGAGPKPEQSVVANRVREIKRELDLWDGRTLLTVSRLVPRKGIDLVLRSVMDLIAGLPDLRYIVAGDGPERHRLEELAAELHIDPHVRFLGHVDDLTKWALYELCDIFVLPNRLMGGADWEGFGIVFLEAALAGRPSVGGRNGGVTDAVRDGETGLLVDPEDRNALTASLRTLLSDDELRRRMGAAAAAIARTKFNWDRIAAAFRAMQGWA